MKRGTRCRPSAYDVTSGKPWRPGSNFQPVNAAKLSEICQLLDMSVAGFLDELIGRLDVDPHTGLPVGWPERVQLKEAG